MQNASPVTRWLSRAPAPVFTGYAVVVAFATYFCMYAYRKAFAVARFPGSFALPLLGAVDAKIVFIVAQVLGYCLSKFLGIKVVSEMKPARRAWALLGAIVVAELALLGFALAPGGWGALFLFLNGIPLGMVWGLVFGFLEGRQTSDLLGAGLCASFILASGFVKTAGKWVLDAGVSERWMPAATGALFFPAIALFIALLAQIPPPTAEDEKRRLRREPMDGPARWRFFVAVWPGLCALVAAYMLLTAYRDFRDNFARELWDALGYGAAPSVMTTAELPVAFGSLLAVAAVMVVKDNRRALLVIHGLLLLGAILVGGSTLLFSAGMLAPAPWMVLVGLGLYIGYVPYNCVLFDRLLPAVGFVGTAGFLIYVADAFGYLGSVSVLLYKSFAEASLSWLGFFEGFSYATSAVGGLLFLLSALYFWRRQPSVATS